jgi:hypothetical protein
MNTNTRTKLVELHQKALTKARWELANACGPECAETWAKAVAEIETRLALLEVRPRA